MNASAPVWSARRNAVSGFTLIEILVALVIVAIVGLSAQQRIGQFNDERGVLRDRQHAHWVAWNSLMLQYQLANKWYPNDQPKLEQTGETKQLGRTWYFHTEQLPTVSEGFFRFDTHVYDQPYRAADISQTQQNSASLAMFLVLQ